MVNLQYDFALQHYFMMSCAFFTITRAMPGYLPHIVLHCQ